VLVNRWSEVGTARMDTKVGDGSASRARNVDFAFVQTRLSNGFHSTALLSRALWARRNMVLGGIRRVGASRQSRGASSSVVLDRRSLSGWAGR
jgi:hypothetical protein